MLSTQAAAAARDHENPPILEARYSTAPRLSFVPTCDLYDQYLDKARVPTLAAAASWKSFGGKSQFCGYAVTVSCFGDNSRVLECLQQAHMGHNSVLVIDNAGATMKCAMLGDKLAQHAVDNHWEGIVVHGCVRDVHALRTMSLGIMALGCTPRKSTRHGQGQVNVPIMIGDVECRPGDHVYADEDGIVILDP